MANASPDPTKAPVPRAVYEAAKRLRDGPALGDEADLDVLRAWYFAGRAPGPGPGAMEVAVWALFMARDYGIKETSDAP